MKKLISIVCVVLVVFCMFNVFEEKPQAVFVADDAFIVSVIGSVLLSIALSEGIALATGGESVYTGVANAIWDYFLTGEAQGDVNEAINKLRLYGSFVYQGGKFYFALNQNGYNFFRSWIAGIDWNDIRLESNLVVNNNDFISIGTTGGALELYQGKYSIATVGSPMTFSTSTYTSSVISNGSVGTLQVILKDGTVFTRHFDISSFTSRTYILFQVNRSAQVCLIGGGMNRGGNVVGADSIENTTSAKSTFGSTFLSWDNNSSNAYDSCSAGRLTYSWLSNGYRVNIDGTPIFTRNYQKNYGELCFASGVLLCNISNDKVPVNTNSSNTTVSTPVEFEEVAPAIPNNTGIGRNQIALIPVPGNTVDASDESIVLSPGQVKDYDKEGKDYTFIPVPGQLQGKTGADLGVTVMNKTTFEETSTPVYTGSVPDVFPTASPDVTITAGADVFPTVAPTEAPTAGEGSTADAIAGDIADIKDEVGDLSTPLTPPQAQDGTNKLKIPQLLLTKFPFCIPYDFYNAINQFNAEAEMPSFDIPFHFAQINFDYTMHIDFERFTTLAKICQWFFSVSWVVILILLTRKVIWK